MKNKTKTITDQAILYRLYCERSPGKAEGFAAGLSEVVGLDASDEQGLWLHPQAEIQVRWLDPYLNDTLMIEIVWNSDG
jgi:hypothetical protein